MRRYRRLTGDSFIVQLSDGTQVSVPSWMLDSNDRLLLGLQGTMSEFELSLLRQRARQACEQKVERGHLMWEVPVGLVRTDEHRFELTPDRQVRQAVAGVFRKFRELGASRQTALWYGDHAILLPQARPGTSGREVDWVLPTESRVRRILKNPSYAGALGYGRTAAKTAIVDGRVKQAGRRCKPQEEWKVLILDNHPGYISWEEYQKNQESTWLPNRDGQDLASSQRGERALRPEVVELPWK